MTVTDSSATSSPPTPPDPTVTDGHWEISRRRRAWLALRAIVNWRLALVLTVSNALVLVAVVAIVPGISFDPGRPVLHLVILAAVYGLLKAFVKPLVQFFVLSYLVATYGLVLLGESALMLWLLSLLSFGTFTIDGVIPLLFGTVVARALTLPLESILGTRRPIVDHASETGPS